MNYGISILFRAIPLLMALFCFGYGAFVLHEGLDSAKFVAGPVVFSLGMICIALFATAATIIRQIIHTYNPILARTGKQATRPFPLFPTSGWQLEKGEAGSLNTDRETLLITNKS